MAFIAYTERVFFAMVSSARFLWTASAGHRLRPWRSDYLKWRMETYTGRSAETIRLRDFVQMAATERRQLVRFFRWVNALGGLSGRKKAA